MPVHPIALVRTLRSSSDSQPRWLSYVLLSITAATGGAALVVVKPALSHATATDILLIRFLIASILATPWIWKYWQQVKNKLRTIALIVVLELIGTTATLTLLYEGLARTSALEANILATSAPIFMVLAGIILLKEKQELHETIGLMIAFTATLILTILPAVGTAGTVAFSLVGNGLIIGQNIGSGIYFSLAKKHYHQLPKLFVTGISFYVGVISFTIVNIARQGWSIPNFLTHNQAILQHPSVWLAAVYLAVFCSIIGLTSYIKGQDGIEASEASFFLYLQPLIYIPLIVLFLHEPVSINQLLLLGLILLGVVVAERR